MRLFVAVEFPRDVREAIAVFLGELRRQVPDVRWLDPSKIHLTLKFLGEVADARRAELDNRLESCVADVPGPIPIHVKGVGTFGGRAPRVVWAGVDAPRLGSLRDAVEEAGAACGLPRESKPFKPHLTLARLKNPSRRLSAALPYHTGRDLGRFETASCALVRSLLSPEGATYVRLRAFPLGAGG